ncbi:MAG: hypothetical protein ACFFED_14900 [Candidatus Thorarchaeota archaeon]
MSKKINLIRTRGLGLSLRLFKYEKLDMTATALTKKLKEFEYKPKKGEISSGFMNVKTAGTITVAEFMAEFRVPYFSYSDTGDRVGSHVVSLDKAEVLIKTESGTIEVRGSERIASKFARLLEEATGAKVSVLNLNGGIKKLYEKASDISAVLLSDVEKGPLHQIEFRGSGIQTEPEVGMYERRYKGAITRFRGSFVYPTSKAMYPTVINGIKGSLMIYGSGDGIPEKDVEWIVKMMEDAAP